MPLVSLFFLSSLFILSRRSCHWSFDSHKTQWEGGSAAPYADGSGTDGQAHKSQALSEQTENAEVVWKVLRGSNLKRCLDHVFNLAQLIELISFPFRFLAVHRSASRSALHGEGRLQGPVTRGFGGSESYRGFVLLLVLIIVLCCLLCLLF